MQLTLTSKVRLYPTAEQAQQFKQVAIEYQRVCNLVSQWEFDKQFKVNQKIFQKELYHQIRVESGLNSMMVQSTYRTVEAHYKTVEMQLKQRPYHFQDKNTGKWYRFNQNLEWLRKPIRFRRPQADYLRNSNYSFVKQGTLISINVLGKRIKVRFNDKYTQSWFNYNAKLGTAKLVQSSGHWFLHIPVTMEVEDWEKSTNQHIVGIDRGLRQIMTIYDEQGRTKFFNGKHITYQRHKYSYLRQKLSKRY